MSSAWSRLNICTKTLSTYSQNIQEGIFLTNGLYNLTLAVLSLSGKSVCGAIFSFYISLCQDTCCFVQGVLGSCLTMSVFGINILYKATGSPCSENLLIWDVSADHALFSGTPGTALRVLWVCHQEADRLLQFLKGLYHPLDLADVVQRAFYWFVIAKVNFLPLSLLHKPQKQGAMLLSN